MALNASSFRLCILMLITLISSQLYISFSTPARHRRTPRKDIDLLQFSQNLIFLQTEWFLWGGLGHGIDAVNPKLANHGPSPTGARQENLDNFTKTIVTEFGYQGLGHLRTHKDTVGLIPRPQIDLSAELFAKVIDAAFVYKLNPPFDPYQSSLGFFLATYAVPYIGLTGLLESILSSGVTSKRVLAGLLGVQAGQDAVIRLYLYERANEVVHYYNHTVAEFTTCNSNVKNLLARAGDKDEGIVVQRNIGAENQTSSNILSANYHSLSYRRTPAEILRIVYVTGKENTTGGFLPKGANGRFAEELLKDPQE